MGVGDYIREGHGSPAMSFSTLLAASVNCF